MAKNKGDYIDRIVEMLERSLTQDAVVQRNVQLPIIGSSITNSFNKIENGIYMTFKNN